jgi:hypothetical protein
MRLRQGQAVNLAGIKLEAGEVAVVDEAGDLVAVGRWQPRGQLLRPEKVWPI